MVRAVIADLPELAATIKRLMARYEGTWTLCGGWAVDVWLGRVTREHRDIDIAVFRDEQRLFFEPLADWHFVAHETDDADHHIPWDSPWPVSRFEGLSVYQWWRLRPLSTTRCSVIAGPRTTWTSATSCRCSTLSNDCGLRKSRADD